MTFHKRSIPARRTQVGQAIRRLSGRDSASESTACQAPCSAALPADFARSMGR
jgi:hypothetical protein